jgi:hypothetical protein
VFDHGVEAGLGLIGFAIDPAGLAEVVEHDVDAVEGENEVGG